MKSKLIGETQHPKEIALITQLSTTSKSYWTFYILRAGKILWDNNEFNTLKAVREHVLNNNFQAQ